MEYIEEKEVIKDLKKCENCHYRDRENCMCEINYNYKKVILNLLEKQQKEIEIKDKRINALQRIIGKDLPTNQAYISTFCGIPIEEAMDMIEICKTQTIHLNDQEYKKVVELAQKDCIPKETIRNKIKELENQKISIKVGFEKIFETKMNNAKIIDTLRELLRGE